MRFVNLFIFGFIFYSNLYSEGMDLLSFSSQTQRVDFVSEHAFYNEATGDLHLSSNVIINQISENNLIIKRIKSEDVKIYTSSHLAIFDTDFSIEDSSGIIMGSKGYYNYDSFDGYMENGVSYMKKFIFKGKKIEIKKGKFLYKSANITTCDKTPPHYHIYASRAYIYPGSRFLSYNNLFYLGKYPIFYFPVIYKPLGEGTPILSQFYPGSDGRNGFYIKSNYIYKFTKYTKLKVFIDYFARKGWGTGTEYDHYNSEKNITSISYYRIDEFGKAGVRWGLNGGMWHLIRKDATTSLYVQDYFRLLSDPYFNNDFFRSNPFTISKDKQASIALTYNTPRTTSRLSTSIKYDATADDKFVSNYVTVPRLDLQIVPIRFASLYHSFSFYAENAKNYTTYYQKNMGLNYTVSKPISISKKFIFNPSAFFYQKLYFSTSSANSDIWQNRYGYDLNLRHLNSWGNIDLDLYTLRRNKINTLKLDTSAADKGIEEKNLSSSLFFMKDSNSYMRFSGKYDLKDYDSEPGFKKRLYPFLGELYKKVKNVEFFLQDSYHISKGNRYLISQLNIGDENQYFNVGVANYADNKKRYIISNALSFYLPYFRSWRAELAVRYAIDFALEKNRVDIFEKELTLYKDFHDFRTKFNLRVRRDVKEFFAYITLKMNDPYKNEELDKEADYYWRPWRKKGDTRD